MKKVNILDIGLQTVRTSGKTEMLSKKAVQYWAYYLGFFELVTWLEEATPADFINYLHCVDWDKTPSLEDIEYVLSLEDEIGARQCVEEEFEKEIQNFDDTGKIKELNQLPFSFEEAEWEGSFYDYIQEHAPDHAYSYYLTIRGVNIFWFKDYFYVETNKKTGKDSFEELSGKEWLSLTSSYNSLSNESKQKFHTIDEQMKLATLLERY